MSDNQHSTSAQLHSLTESNRIAYLQAMDIVLWVPRNPSEAEVKLQCKLAASQPQQAADNVKSVSQTAASKTSLAATTINTVDSQHLNKQFAELGASTETSSPTNAAVSQTASLTTNSAVDVGSAELKHYLKMVSWVSAADSAQSILIVCRHQVDQPAQSFAKANSPSQFMQDYVQAINELMRINSQQPQVRLAHLSQAGLSADCQPLSQILESINPQLVLVLGEEAVTELFSSEHEVAKMRGKVYALNSKTQCLVSYHPFTLIHNPHLKKLALEDLNLVAKLFAAKPVENQ